MNKPTLHIVHKATLAIVAVLTCDYDRSVEGNAPGSRSDAAAGCEHAAGQIDDRKYRSEEYMWSWTPDGFTESPDMIEVEVLPLSKSDPAEITPEDEAQHIQDLVDAARADFERKRAAKSA
jgi:hypothetical protein